ncbi:MAG: FHA domain-containing protein [Clostridia bacterium]|nr:FHA domain-containing protein [Clostridia bacterium]
MAIISCANNHYFDDEKYNQCPFCNIENDIFEEDKTVAKFEDSDWSQFFDNIPDESLTKAFFEDVSDDDDRTIGLLQVETKSNPVAGWLVCTSGSVKGKSYELHLGRNYIGRKKDMDVVLTDDDTICRQRHFSIIYDPKSNEFYAVPDDGFIYINNVSITQAAKLIDGDEIHVGNTFYTFIAYCNENRRWL